MSLGKFRKFITRQLTTVGSTLTTILSFDKTGHAYINVEIQNPSGVDSIDGQIECASAETGPWDVMDWDGLADITPGETRNEAFSAYGKTWLRVRAVSTGSAIPNVPVTVHAESP